MDSLGRDVVISLCCFSFLFALSLAFVLRLGCPFSALLSFFVFLAF